MYIDYLPATEIAILFTIQILRKNHTEKTARSEIHSAKRDSGFPAARLQRASEEHLLSSHASSDMLDAKEVAAESAKHTRLAVGFVSLALWDGGDFEFGGERRNAFGTFHVRHRE